jgi:hypothetical protein
MPTASRLVNGSASGSFTTLFTHVLEDWWNGRKAEDIVFNNVPVLYVLSRTSKKTRPLPAFLNVRILESKSAGVDAFGGYDTVSTASSKGAQAASFPVSNYAAPLAMSLEEEWEFTSPQAIADRLEEYVEQVELSMADRIAKDIYKGSSSNSKNVIGLEDICYADTQAQNTTTDAETTLGYINDRWRARQATNTLGGITRVAFTDVETTGTGWENVSIDFLDTSAGNTFGLSSGAPNAALKALFQLYSFCSYGVMHPDLIISSQQPFDDYEFAGFDKQRFAKEGGALKDVNLAFDNIKFKGAMWIMDEFATTRNSSLGNATSAKQRLYMLNTRMIDLAVDSRADFALRKPKEPTDQLAAVRHMVWRGQLVARNPRYLGTIFDYGT